MADGSPSFAEQCHKLLVHQDLKVQKQECVLARSFEDYSPLIESWIGEDGRLETPASVCRRWLSYKSSVRIAADAYQVVEDTKSSASCS